MSRCLSLFCPVLFAACIGGGEGPLEPAADRPPARLTLDSGEQLVGKITRLRRGTLVFDSEALDEQEIDWSEVEALSSDRSMMLVFEDQVSIVGRIDVDGDAVRITDPEGVSLEFPRDAMVAVVPGEEKEVDYWSGGLSVSIAARSGNTDQIDSSTLFSIERDTAGTRGALDYTTTYSETNGEAVANNQRATGNFDVFLSNRFFARPVSFEFYRDEFQGIDSRTTAGAGFGYELFDTESFDWNITAGAGWQWIEFRGAQLDGTDSEDDGTGFARTQLEWDITNDVEFVLDYQIQAAFQGGGDVNHNLRSTLSVELFDDLDLDVGIQFDRIGKPVPLSDGSLPNRDDVRLLIGIGFDF